MEFSNDCLIMLEHMDDPAFIANRDTIVHVNEKASQIGLQSQTPLAEILGEMITEENPQGNTVSSIQFRDVQYVVSIVDLGQVWLYKFKQSNDMQQLQSLTRAAQQLRVPLTGLSSSIGILKQSEYAQDTETAKLLSRATKQLFSLQRAVRNMSDISLFLCDRSNQKETVDAAAFIGDISAKLIQHLEYSGVQIGYSGPQNPIYCSLDPELIERALYNLVSNSLKAACKSIEITLTKKGETLHLTVTDDGCGISLEDKTRIFSQFNQAPGWNMQNYGLGLGMVVVHAAVVAHKGVLLIKDIKPHGCKITLTLAIEHAPTVLKQDPVLIHIDTLGGTDQLLLELSDILPPTHFE